MSTTTRPAVDRARRLFQGHYESRAWGRWFSARRSLPTGTFIVPVSQSLGALAMYLLEPESDDGLATWNLFDAAPDGRRLLVSDSTSPPYALTDVRAPRAT